MKTARRAAAATPHAARIEAGLLLAVGLAVVVGGPARAGTALRRELEPYRAFAETARGRGLLTIAREAMRSYWHEGRGAPGTDSIPWPGAPVSVYVSLVGPGGTRACVGSAPAYRSGLAETVASLARRALHSDPRREPVREEELNGLRVVISFAGEGEPVSDPMGVDPGREGLLVTSGERSVAFLPGEARTVSWALREARRIHVLEGPASGAVYRRFPVVSLTETASHPSREESDAAP